MKRISQEEYSATHRIFNHVERLVGPYYGRKSIDQAMEYVSANRWIMFPVNGITSLRDGTVYPMPNVFIYRDDELLDNGQGKMDGCIGVTYHNVEAMIAFRDMLKRKSTQLLNILSGFSDDWSVEIQHKTKTDCVDSVPNYNTFRAFKPSGLTADIIRNAIDDSDSSLPEKGTPYCRTGNPILWSVTIFVVVKPVTVETFDADVKKIFDVFFRLLDCRTRLGLTKYIHTK
jgi:hypothetical protein